MLNDGKPILYWDACVPLSYINGDIPARLPDIEGLLQRGEKDFHIITSILSITEVAFAQTEQDQVALDPALEARIHKLWRRGSPIQLVELFQSIAEDARDLMRIAITQKWHLKPHDAIHLATADHYKVSKFHTYDDKLKKYEAITKTHFVIEPPLAAQPVIVMSEELSLQEAAEQTPTPSKGVPDATVQATDTNTSGPSEPAKTSNELQTDSAHPAPVQGSDGRRVEGETATEGIPEGEARKV
jgi:predicted nucleic acid-binding protein